MGNGQGDEGVEGVVLGDGAVKVQDEESGHFETIPLYKDFVLSFSSLLCLIGLGAILCTE